MAKALMSAWALPELIRKSAPTMTATVPMCHHTETSLSMATILMPAMFSTSWMIIRTAIVNSWPLTSVEPKISEPLPYAIPKLDRIGVTMPELTNEAAAKSMPATMAIWPARLNQAVHQPQSLFFIRLDQ